MAKTLAASYPIIVFLAYIAFAFVLATLTIAISVSLRVFWEDHLRRTVHNNLGSTWKGFSPYWQDPTQRFVGLLVKAITSAPALIILFVIYFLTYVLMLVHFAPLDSRAAGFVGHIEINAPTEKIAGELEELKNSQSAIAAAIREQTDNIKNINDAIRARKDAENTPVVIIPRADSTNSAGGSGWGHYFLIAMLLVIFPSFLFGVGYFAENYLAETRAAKYSLRAVASGLALVSISIGTIVTIKDLTILHVTYAPQSGGQGESQSQSQQGTPQIQKVIINIPESRQKSILLDCGSPKAPEKNSGGNREGNEMRIGPFPIGWANPEDNKDGNPDVIRAFELTRESLIKVAQLIRQQVSPHKNLVGLTLIGSFDKLPLGPDLRKKYGENAGLAMARAIWVKDQFAKQEKLIRETQMVVMTAGPGHTELEANGQVIRLDQTVQQDAGDQDRAVQVCATWEESP